MIIQPEHWKVAEPWIAAGACRTYDPELFFPASGGDEATPIAICGECLVRLACLDYALEANERWGVWGGTTQRYRRRLVRALRRKAA